MIFNISSFYSQAVFQSSLTSFRNSANPRLNRIALYSPSQRHVHRPVQIAVRPPKSYPFYTWGVKKTPCQKMYYERVASNIFSTPAIRLLTHRTARQDII